MRRATILKPVCRPHRGLVLLTALAIGVSAPWLIAVRSAQDLPIPAREITFAISEGTNFRATASLDRRSIAIDLVGALWVLPIGGGEARRVTPEDLEARHPSWSPDGKSLAFQGYGDNAWHIYTVAIAGGAPRRITDGPFDDQDPDWSPDGRTIVFSSDRAGGTQTVWQVEIERGDPHQLSQWRGSDPCWIVSPVSARDVAFLGPPDPAAPRTPPPPPAWWVVAEGTREILLDAFLPPQSRSEGIVACASGRTLVGPSERLRTSTEDLFPFRPQWIGPADLLYTADGHIKRRRVNAQGIVVPFQATFTIHRTAYGRKHRDLQPATPRPVNGIVSPAVSPDGSSIAFIALGDLWLMPIGGAPVRLTNDPYVELDPAWSPDGSQLAFSSDRGGSMNVWIHDFRSGMDRAVTDAERPVRGASWSPDGHAIAYQVGRRGLEATGVDNRNRLWSFSSAAPPGRPTWGSTPTTLGFGQLFPYALGGGFPGGTNQLGLYSTTGNSATGEVLVVHHSAGDRENGGPVWSPDGSRVAYVSEGELWTQAVDAKGKPIGDRSSIATDMPEAPSWEGDSRHLAYQLPDGFRRAAVDGGDNTATPVSLAWSALPPPDPLVIHAGRVFDGRSPDLLRSIDISIEGGRIREIGPHHDDRHVGRVIDASDLTVMPGLIESAAQLDPGYGEGLGRLWLAYGVTTVVDPGSGAYALEMRESYDAGRRMGPRVLAAGPPFAGIRVLEPGGVSIGSLTQLETALPRAARLGYDFFSTYVRLSDAFHQRVIAAAHDRGLMVVASQLLLGAALSADEIAPLRDVSRRGGSARISPSNISYRDVIEIIARSGMTLLPALGAEGAFRLIAGRDRDLAADPRLSLFPAAVAAEIRDLPGRFRLLSPAVVNAEELKIKALGNTVAAIVAAGGTVVAGTNPAAAARAFAPTEDQVPYGLGLHIEIEAFARAGLRPFEALQSATLKAAETLGMDDDLGSIEPGKLADLVFLEGNPLDDISATRTVQAVMRGGWYYDRRALGLPAP